jgi:glutathione S-transferase
VITLYCATIDADCLAARLLLDILGLEYETVPVDAYPGRDAASRTVLGYGPLPVLREGAVTVAGLRPVLAHLARGQPEAGTRWLDFACGELAAVRVLRDRALAGDLPAAAALDDARRTLLVLEDAMTERRLRGARWFSGAGPGLADLALYPAVALSRDIDLEHDEFPALRHWLRDVRALAPAVRMPGILDPL